MNMKILTIGDPHGSLEKVKRIPMKDIDLILLTGDLGSANLMRRMAYKNIMRRKQGLPEKEYTPTQEKRAFMEAYKSTIELVRYLSKFAQVYAIFGNVESSNYETRKQSKEIGIALPFLSNDLNAMENVIVINNRVANFNGVRIGGLEYFIDINWIRAFKICNREKTSKAKRETDKAKKVLKQFNSLDILLCHQPPFGILDKVTAKFAPKHWQGKHAGSKLILDFIKRKQPRYVFCGHIHEGEGMKRIGKTEVYNLGVAGYKVIEI